MTMKLITDSLTEEKVFLSKCFNEEEKRMLSVMYSLKLRYYQKNSAKVDKITNAELLIFNEVSEQEMRTLIDDVKKNIVRYEQSTKKLESVDEIMKLQEELMQLTKFVSAIPTG